MEIKTFEELTTYDERVAPTARRDPMTDAPVLSPLAHIQGMVAGYDLVAAVPSHVRDRFETCRKLHTYGCFAYEFFTVAMHYAYATVEAALGARFIAFYPAGVPLENEHGVLDYLHPTFYSAVADALRPGGTHPHRRRGHNRGWILQGHPAFNGSLRSLLEWAWTTELLSGQRNRVVEGALHQLRNLAAHPHGPWLVSQVESAGAIRDVAEIANHLWGQDTPSGRLYGMPRATMLVCLHRSANGNAAVFPSLLSLHSARTDDRQSTGIWALLEVVDPDEAFAWVPDHEWTAYPAAVVWRGDSWARAVEAWEGYDAAGRQPQPQEWRGRLFLVRCTAADPQRPLELPRSPAQFRALAPEHRDPPGTIWWIIRADHPGDAVSAWRAPETIPALFRERNREELVPARIELEGGTWQQAEARLVELK